METRRWIREEENKHSLTSIPEAVIRDKVVSFLGERAAFNARGICMLFATAYFDQDYQRSNGTRVFTMLAMGHKYRKLKILVLKYYNVTDLSSLRGIPSLTELSLPGIEELDLETFPDTLLFLTKLDLPDCNLENLAPLYRLPTLIKLDLSGN